MLRFASAFLLACATAKLCTTDANCTDEDKKCKINPGAESGVCRKFEEALVVQLVGAETGNVDGNDYPTTAIKGTIYLTGKGQQNKFT